MFMSFIFKYTLFSLQGHICLLQGHKVCTRTRYFNACRFLLYIAEIHDGFKSIGGDFIDGRN